MCENIISWFGKTTEYFRKCVLRKRPYIRPEWIKMAREGNYLVKEIQPDGRVRVWLKIEESNKYLRVVFLEDGVTVHNAFFDRGFEKRRGGK